MNISDIASMQDDFITASVAGQVLNTDPQSIREQAKRDSSKLGFPVIVIGHRVKIPRVPFVRYVTGEQGGA